MGEDDLLARSRVRDKVLIISPGLVLIPYPAGTILLKLLKGPPMIPPPHIHAFVYSGMDLT
jgi:hypothetical protein